MKVSIAGDCSQLYSTNTSIHYLQVCNHQSWRLTTRGRFRCLLQENALNDILPTHPPIIYRSAITKVEGLQREEDIMKVSITGDDSQWYSTNTFTHYLQVCDHQSWRLTTRGRYEGVWCRRRLSMILNSTNTFTHYLQVCDHHPSGCQMATRAMQLLPTCKRPMR